MIAALKEAFGKVWDVYEWVSDILADNPKIALAMILILAVAALV
jgi:hypothetical protein